MALLLYPSLFLVLPSEPLLRKSHRKALGCAYRDRRGGASARLEGCQDYTQVLDAGSIENL
jgi:hypothetical protein